MDKEKLKEYIMKYDELYNSREQLFRERDALSDAKDEESIKRKNEIEEKIITLSKEWGTIKGKMETEAIKNFDTLYQEIGMEAVEKMSPEEFDMKLQALLNDVREEMKKDEKETKVETPKQELKNKTSEKLLEEYTIYEELISNQKRLSEELLTFSGKTDEESIKRINEIASSLGEVKNKLSNYDLNVVNKFQNYYRIQRAFNTICDDIKAVERLSKKSKGKKLQMHSAEGRKRMIDAELAEDYKALISQKNKIRTSVKKGHTSLIGVTTMMTNNPSIEMSKEESKNEEMTYVLPKIIGYDDLSVEDKIKETKERLQRIFKTSSLPNQGKKIMVTYEGKKYSIPRKYQGIYKETLKELGLLNAKKTRESSELKDIKINDLLPKAKGYTEEMMKSTRVFQREEDERIFNELFKNCPPKKQDEIYEMLFSKEAIDRKNELLDNLTKQIELEPTLKQRITSGKAFVIKIGKQAKEKLVKIGQKLKEKLDKTTSSIKENINETKYEIVNKTINFQKNTCQKVSSKKTEICNIAKKDLLAIQIKFHEIKEKMELNREKRKYSKDELFEMIKQLQEENKAKEQEIAKYKSRIKTLEGSRGYAAISTLTILGFILLAITIFTIVGKIVNH